MFNRFKFEDVEIENSFEHGVTDMIYFPVTDSADFPKEIREKTEEIIDHIIHTHELDISKIVSVLNAENSAVKCQKQFIAYSVGENEKSLIHGI